MVKRTREECEQHYQELRTKKRKSIADRIFLYLYKYRSDVRWGTSTHEMVDGYFFVRQGDRNVATDGLRPVPWQSMGSAIGKLREEGWVIESTWTHPDPITNNSAARLYPCCVPDDWWKNKPQEKLI